MTDKTNINKNNNSDMDAGLKKTCTICTKTVDKQYFPFCSKRCADVDLGRWLKGAYAMPVEDSYDGNIALSNDIIDNKNDP